MEEITLPPGWISWHEDPDGTLIWTFRPDVFDGQRVPAACLPTLTVKRERHRGPRGRPAMAGADRPWTIQLLLEPGVSVAHDRRDERTDALDRAHGLATAFAADELDYRAAYQRPREEYLALLEELLPAETSDFSGRPENGER